MSRLVPLVLCAWAEGEREACPWMNGSRGLEVLGISAKGGGVGCGLGGVLGSG